MANVSSTFPQLFANFTGEVLFLISLHRSAEIIVLNRPQKIAVGHRKQRQIQLFGIHRLNRNRSAAQPRQHISPPRKPHAGAAVAHIGGQRDRLCQRLPIGGRQAFPEGKGIPLPVLNTFHTNLPCPHRLNGQTHIVHLHETGIIHPGAEQILGEIRAKTWPCAIRLHLILRNPKAVFPNRAVQQPGRIIARLQSLRQTQRLHRIAPPVDAFQCLGHRDQNGMPQRRRFGPQVGVDRAIVSPLAVAPLRIAVGLPRDQQQTRIIGPSFRRIGDIYRGPSKPACQFGVTACFRIKRRLQMFFCSESVCDMRVGHTFRLRKSRRYIPIRHKWQFGAPRCRPLNHCGICVDQIAGIGP